MSTAGQFASCPALNETPEFLTLFPQSVSQVTVQLFKKIVFFSSEFYDLNRKIESWKKKLIVTYCTVLNCVDFFFI